MLLLSLTLVVFTAPGIVIAGIFIILVTAALVGRKKLLTEFLDISVIDKRFFLILPIFLIISCLIYRDLYIGIVKGVIFLFRIGILILSALIFVSTTSQFEMIDTLMAMRIPYEFAFMLNIAIRFIPVLARECKEVLDVQRARAYKINYGNFHAVVIPTVIILLKRSYEVSLALYTRGFHRGQRARRNKLYFKLVDYSIILLAIIAAVASVFFY